MPLTLTQLLVVESVDVWRTRLLTALQGIGVVVKGGVGPGGVGSGTGSMSVSGTPVQAYPKIVINIVTSGELSVAQFQYSLDGGSTFSGTQTVPAAPGIFALPGTGVSLTFAVGPTGAGVSFVIGDQYTFALNVPSLPVTSWPASSGYRQLVEIEAQALAAFSGQQAAIAAGGFTSTATGAWADLLGSQFYNLTRNAAAITAGQITLFDTAGAGPFTISVGTMWFISNNGFRYFNTTGGTLPKNGSLVIQVSAESPGLGYNVANATISTIVAGTLPGVTVDNSTNLISGSWITSQGSDAEADSAYMLRCQQRWPGLGTGATAAVYKLWATSAEQAVGHPTTITRVLAITDAIVPGQVDIYLAGASGTVGGGAVTDAQTYITPRVPLTATALITAASNLAITIAGTVNYFQSLISGAAILAGILSSLDSFFRSLAIGDGLGTTKVYYTAIYGVVFDGGESFSVTTGETHVVRSITGLLINGGSADITLTLGQVAIYTNSLTLVGV